MVQCNAVHCCPSVVNNAHRVGSRQFQTEGLDKQQNCVPNLDVIALNSVRLLCDT